MKRLYVLVLGAGLISLLAGVIVGPSIQPVTRSDLPVADVANWASQAVTIADQIAEADLVVRAKVIKVNPTRKLRQVGPRYSLDAKVDKNGVKTIPFTDSEMVAKVDDRGVNIMPFTDSEMVVSEVYKGPAEQYITVMQTGGSLPATDGDPAMNLVTLGEPLFVVGSEYVLFLKDITGDSVHGGGRKLYRAVNPAGRYEIRGTTVLSTYEFPATFTPPRTLDELVRQIKQALALQ